MPTTRTTPLAFIRALTCGLIAGATGCFPAITHGPKIEDGLIVGLTGALPSGPEHVEGDEGGIRLRNPVLGPYAGFGVASTRPQDAGYYVGVAVPLLFPLTQVDAFVQLPPALTGPLSAGVGMIASIEHVDGYAMLGGQIDRLTAWHIGLGYGTRWPESNKTKSAALVGSLALEKAHGRLRTQFFVQFAHGRPPQSCPDYPGAPPCSDAPRETATAAGMSIGRHSRSAGR
jgi:hypothetical protein